MTTSTPSRIARQLDWSNATLTQSAGDSGKQLERTFRWTHRGLKAQQPLPGFPNVDVAP